MAKSWAGELFGDLLDDRATGNLLGAVSSVFMNPKDIEGLVDFLHSTRGDLSFIIDVSREYISSGIHDLLNSAWEAVQTRGELEIIAMRIGDKMHDQDLPSNGLSGDELAFKLAGWKAAKESCMAAPSRGLLKRWLKWINVILGSLLAATGIGESVKELKEGIEAELEEDV